MSSWIPLILASDIKPSHNEVAHNNGDAYEDRSAGLRKQSIVAMTENATGEIRNPLSGMSKGQLMADVDSFATKYGMEAEIPLLRKGALVAQAPAELENIPDLDETDRQFLREEVTHRWRHPKALYFTIIMNSIAAAIQGWDQEGKLRNSLTGNR